VARKEEQGKKQNPLQIVRVNRVNRQLLPESSECPYYAHQESEQIHRIQTNEARCHEANRGQQVAPKPRLICVCDHKAAEHKEEVNCQVTPEERLRAEVLGSMTHYDKDRSYATHTVEALELLACRIQ
jgi:hypothetical protein